MMWRNGTMMKMHQLGVEEKMFNWVTDFFEEKIHSGENRN